MSIIIRFIAWSVGNGRRRRGASDRPGIGEYRRSRINPTLAVRLAVRQKRVEIML